MKTPIFFVALILFSAIGAFSQARPVLDNFDIRGGVRVRNLPGDAPKAITTVSGSKRRAVRHYIPSPMTGDDYARAVSSRSSIAEKDLIKTTVQRTRIVYDDYMPTINRMPAVNYTKLITATGNHLKGYSTGDVVIDAFIVDSSKRYSIDPLLIYSQMSQESSFKRGARSKKGASGLMQLMPATARRLGVTDIYDPQQNIEGGVKYMRILLNLFDGDVDLALAGYNAGEGAVMKYGYQIPPYNETQDYVRRISTRYRSLTGVQTARNTRTTAAFVR
jgi:hypothetical protein